MKVKVKLGEIFDKVFVPLKLDPTGLPHDHQLYLELEAEPVETTGREHCSNCSTRLHTFCVCDGKCPCHQPKERIEGCDCFNLFPPDVHVANCEEFLRETPKERKHLKEFPCCYEPEPKVPEALLSEDLWAVDRDKRLMEKINEVIYYLEKQ